METLTFELKAASDEGPGTFEGIMSAPVLDRDNEIVDSKCFEPLPAHIPIDIDHGLTVEKTVGSGVPFYDHDGLLKVKGTFASTPLGQMTRTLVKEGHIRHMSVAFRNPVRELDEVDGKQHVRKGELINCTITGIPANVATAVTAKVGARNSAKDAERIQSTHDHMVDLGATCGEKCAPAPAVKANVASWSTTNGNGDWITVHPSDVTTTLVSGGPVASTSYRVVMQPGEYVLPSGATAVIKSSEEDPDVKAAAPAAAEHPAPNLMANAYVALAKARMLQLDT